MHHRPSSIEAELWAGHVDERPRSRPVVTQNDGCREQWSLVHTFLYTCDDNEADIVLRLIVDTKLLPFHNANLFLCSMCCSLPLAFTAILPLPVRTSKISAVVDTSTS